MAAVASPGARAAMALGCRCATRSSAAYSRFQLTTTLLARRSVAAHVTQENSQLWKDPRSRRFPPGSLRLISGGSPLPCRAGQATGRVESVSQDLGLQAGESPSWEIRMLYDGDCPLCMREVDMFRRMDKEAGKIDFVDISSEDYDPSKNMGLEFETAMKSIHAVLPDGKVILGVEVFRRLYEAVGLGWVYAITKNPTVGALAERVYDFWARNRMAVTGRPNLQVILAQKKTCREAAHSEQQ
mmetsp:Transcript_150/g.543  ORF Transcript_150/g.543 Transcript_150/m.543 type:complete len:242 (-) Transcript_150:269-994(-)